MQVLGLDQSCSLEYAPGGGVQHNRRDV